MSQAMVVVRSLGMEAPLERVWRAVTEAEQLSQWYAPGSPWDIPELRKGACAWFHHSPNEHHPGTEAVTMRATISAVDAPRRFAMRWEFDDGPEGMMTTFLLEEVAGFTYVTMTETGCETEEQTRQTEAGYTMSLANLKALLEGGSLPHT
ncbi:SRPBCC domain-containing protein [Paenibacillus montanisoli]|uniref:SRPBCC domain-containing protein n=1 Tax=Paenibacillus montanisoli TaxID=2081970 RepID=UPI001401E587|nr:SRPBCC domain-containing protein [Paenibacillus montanisoli]